MRKNQPQSRRGNAGRKLRDGNGRGESPITRYAEASTCRVLLDHVTGMDLHKGDTIVVPWTEHYRDRARQRETGRPSLDSIVDLAGGSASTVLPAGARIATFRSGVVQVIFPDRRYKRLRRPR